MDSSAIRRAAMAMIGAAALAACATDVTAPEAATDAAATALAARSADACINVDATASGTLGGWSFNGVSGGGAQPFAIELGGIGGTMASAVSREVVSGSKGQGAHHIFLSHYFWADDGVSWFRTEDRASCAPGDNDATTCLVNDHMRIVEGAGLFAHATGQIHNHGFLRFTAFGPPPAGTIELRIKGRVCGDGIDG